MSWSSPQTWTTGQVVTAADLNAQIRDNLLALSTHGHTGAAGDGGTSLGPLVKADYTDAAAPAAPGAGVTRLYAVSGRLRSRAGASGADSQLVSSLDFTTQGDVPYFNGTSIVRLAPGTSGQFLKTQGGGANPLWANVPTLATISEQTLGAAGNLDFTSIPATYRSLLLVARVKSDSAIVLSDLRMTLNNDGGANAYQYQYLRASSTTVTGSGSTGATFLVIGVYDDTGWSDLVIWIHQYTQTDKINVQGQCTQDPGAAAIPTIQQAGAVYINGAAAAINRVTLIGSGGNLIAGSIGTLYGVPTA